MKATVKNLAIYPLKSGRAMQDIRRLPVSRLEGVSHDRRFMIVTAHDDNRHMVTQRTPGMAAMATVGVELNSVGGPTALRDYKTGTLVSLFFNDEASQTPRIVEVHKQPIEAFDAGDTVAADLTGYFGRPLRLMRLTENQSRPVDEKFAGNGHHVGFADGFPLMIATTPSLEKLRQWSGDDTITMADFRPNIEIDGDFPAFAEDGWTHIQIGEVVLELVKPCSRCVIPEINQTTGIKRDNKQPTTALHKFRQAGKARYFGENAIILRDGVIHTGDEVKVLMEATQPHPLLQGVAHTGMRL